VVGCFEFGDEPSGSCPTELVSESGNLLACNGVMNFDIFLPFAERKALMMMDQEACGE
jgi:hypothetical protein